MQNIIVDANNMLYRAVGNSDSFSKKRGIPVKEKDGVMVGYIQSFLWFLYTSTEEFHHMDSDIYLVWDKKLDKNATNWRNEINPNYKAQRDQESDIRKSVHTTTKHIKKLADSMGIKTIYPLSSECDDVINYLANNLEGDSVIISSDQDFFQCVSDTVAVFNPSKRVTLTPSNFDDNVPVSLENFVKWKAIKGDPSDNIRGLHMYGDVKSKKLVENWDELSQKLSSEDMDTINESIELIDLNARPLSKEEEYAVMYQIGKIGDKASDLDMTEVMDRYLIDQNTRLMWDQYFDLLDMKRILGN